MRTTSRRLPIVLAALSLAALPGLAVGQGGAPAEDTPASGAGLFAEPPEVTELDNGLRVVTIPWESPGIVAYYTLVRVGSRDEVEEGKSGFAHLFEHMMFRGTERFPEAEYEAKVQAFGADNNAYTTQDFTLYTTTAPSSVLPELVELEADRFQRLSYDEAQYRTETGAVRGEYDKNASSPFLRMWESMSEIAFSRHTYGHTTMGYLQDIEAMPENFAYSRQFFRRYYTPDNCTIIVAGDVEHDRLVELVRERYGRWRGRRHRNRVPREPEPREGARRDLAWEGDTPPRLWLGYRTPAFDGGARREAARAEALRETAALDVVHGLLFDPSSPLYQRLVVDERKLLELGSWAGDHNRDPGLFVVTATLPPGGAFDPVLSAIQGDVGRVAAGEVTDARIDAVKSHVRYGLLTGVETPDQAANLVAGFIAVGGDVSAMDDYLAALEAVTKEDVVRVAREYLTEDRRFVVTLAPGAEESEAQADEESEEGEER